MGLAVQEEKELENKEKIDRHSLYGFEMREPDLRRSDRSGTHDIKQLWQCSHEIIALALQGHKQSVIAKLLDVSPVTVSNTLNSELGIQKLSSMREERDKGIINVSKRAAELAEKALKIYEEIFDNETVSYSLKKDTADTVLMDLGGHRSPTKIDTRSMSTTATLQEIEEFKARGLEAARSAGMIVSVPNEGRGNGKGIQAESGPDNENSQPSLNHLNDEVIDLEGV